MVHQKANPQLKLFSLSSNPEIAEKIAEATGLPLGKVSSRQFSDGEIMINIEESVRGDDIYIIQSTSNPVNDHLWELLIMIDACKRASANSVNVVMPYFGYARQDRIAASREPITAKLIANMLVKAGVNRLLTLDLHAVQVQGFFDIPVDNLFTMPLFAEYYNKKGFTGSDVVVVSPKNSGVKRARSLADYLDAPIAIIDYAQDDSEREEGYIIGEVEGKTAILVDDILNTGKTFAEAAKILERGGVKDIYVRIMSPTGSLLNGAGSFSYENRTLQYSMKRSVEYNGEETPVTLFWNVSQALVAGTYQVSIFADGNMIGSRSFAFK